MLDSVRNTDPKPQLFLQYRLHNGFKFHHWVENRPQNKIHKTQYLIFDQEPSSSLSVAPELSKGCGNNIHKPDHNSVHIHKDGLSIIKYLEKSVSYKNIYIRRCTKRDAEKKDNSLLLRNRFVIILVMSTRLFRSLWWNNETKMIWSMTEVEGMLKLVRHCIGFMLQNHHQMSFLTHLKLLLWF